MSKSRIIIVEDEYVVAVDIQKALESLGYDVPAIESTAESAIAKAEQIKPDLVLMDIVLKGEMDGIEAAEQIRSSFNIPVIYLTAYASEEILEDAKITEPFGYLVKPFNTNNLRSTIEMALHKAKIERRREEYVLELQDALARAKTLNGTLTICSACKKIRIQKNQWDHIEEYLREHSDVEFTHGICHECAKKLYPEFYKEKDAEDN
ncbi:MAG: response regulator [Candidatus Glassbacteria bacterium]|nr:response regulator [Candidatus Glassbacteria bacterium]